jgi:hypothetical protein
VRSRRRPHSLCSRNLCDPEAVSSAHEDDPFPTNLPVVGTCGPCNAGASLDEEYVACLIEVAACGSSVPEDLDRPRVHRALARTLRSPPGSNPPLTPWPSPFQRRPIASGGWSRRWRVGCGRTNWPSQLSARRPTWRSSRCTPRMSTHERSSSAAAQRASSPGGEPADGSAGYCPR